MEEEEGWGRACGREVYPRLVDYVESHPGVLVFKISLEGVKRIDLSFASETVVELARRYRGKKGFCFIDLTNPDMRENWDAAADRKELPLMVWEDEKHGQVIGRKPSAGLVDPLQFALNRTQTKAADYVASRKKDKLTIANASMKFKQLWQQGILLRREEKAPSGGVEYTYQRIG